MAIQVSAAATTAGLDLIDLATLKDRLEITDSSQDSRLAGLVDEATSLIETYIGRPLARQTYIETLCGLYRQRLNLSRLPLDRDSVSVTIDGTAETDFDVEDPITGALRRTGGWPSGEGASAIGERPEENVTVTYKAGYVLPNIIAPFAAGAVLTGSWVRPTAPVKDLLMECTTAGTASGAEPTWPTTAGGTVSGGGAVVYTARHAYEIPKALYTAAWLLVHELHTSMSRGLGVRVVQSDDQRIEYYSDALTRGSLPSGVAKILDPWRHGA